MNTKNLSKDDCVKWLINIGVSHSGTLEELRAKVGKFARTPGLVQKLENRSKRLFTFKSSLPLIEVPPDTAKWDCDPSNYPSVTSEVIAQYASLKREGSLGQQEKARQFLLSRKIESVKVLKEGERTFVRAVVFKSYGHETRPAVILFENSKPVKGHCLCAVGLCGLCSHVFALLMFLKHYSDTGEKILALTCTEQLQRWHKRTKGKGSIPMVPLRQLGIVSARRAKTQKLDSKLVPADPSRSSFKRDVIGTLKKVSKNIDSVGINVENHIFKVLQDSSIGQTTALYEHLKFNAITRAGIVDGDHDYCGNPDAEVRNDLSQTIKRKKVEVENAIDRILNPGAQNVELMDNTEPTVSSCSNSSSSSAVTMDQSICDQMKKGSSVSLDLRNQFSAEKFSGSELIQQNTSEWQDLRRFKITGSRFGVLLGLQGNDKFEKYWRMVKEGLQESDVCNTNFVNFSRGHKYENEAIKYFERISGSLTQSSGFLLFSGDPRYGASPDAFAANGLLLEVKTRAMAKPTNPEAYQPLTSLAKNPCYFTQTQLQLLTTDRQYCILQSYSPEHKLSNFFLVKRHNVFLEVAKSITDSLLQNEPIMSWNHTEHPNLKKLGEQLLGRVPTFDTLSQFRRYIRIQCKNLPIVEFLGQ